MHHFKIFVAFFILTSASCKSSNNDIEHYSWKYGEGFNITDWIRFNNKPFNLSHDTIFNNQIPVATIIKLDKSIWGTDKIIIKSLQTGQEGTYYQK